MNFELQGRAAAQVVTHRPLIAYTLVRSNAGPFQVCDRQSGTGTVFFPSISVFPCHSHSTTVPLLSTS